MTYLLAFALLDSDPDFHTGIFIAGITHALTLGAGIALCWMGYRLFHLGIVESAGDAQGKWGNKSIVLKRAAPGTFFGLFGAVVIVAAIWHPFQVNISSGGNTKGVKNAIESYRPGHRSLDDRSSMTPEVKAALGDVVFGNKPLTESNRLLLQNWFITTQTSLTEDGSYTLKVEENERHENSKKDNLPGDAPKQ